MSCSRGVASGVIPEHWPGRPAIPSVSG
jgi:hypothetical protein